jgi:hypothetical protein
VKDQHPIKVYIVIVIHLKCYILLVLLPGFQKGRDIKALAKKGQFASEKEKLEKWTEFHYF